ncbi:16 kDa phloem protein 1 [Impatiens glandulifera]|uniref:16 kDa phloem protein 1 n=1 Tax=Impatiens glandulifera TaxID=253017 RepID=UPI001FB15231|nr:16 kDa phloem protein 1 [Impatiens glandulifera]
MAIGIMEVLLVNAKGLKNNEIFGGGIDPYVVMKYKTQERNSSVARGSGSNPEWNEKFSFRVEYPGGDNNYKLILTVMDKDTFSADDALGQATVYLEDLLAMGVENNGVAEMHPRKYSVVSCDQSYCGEIQVGIRFTPKIQHQTDGEEYGGWKDSEN